ncbi:hypothetical protein NYQ10_05305 [Flavobacterium johnsoniae]|uniref:hypothetical protein n=1 Tax=Flavobacterium johnsoniae TaxID=986 RepID=UPI0025B17BB4|nr:hypothetical protein [Flavobacterium johnsoniae]WJS95872.1 hypothetical protein NYQ10_05305 [Flavobacterium johnsoniae]
MRRIILLIVLCLLFSCERKKPNFSEEMIEMLADRGDTINGAVRLPPPPPSFSDIYIRTNSNQIMLTDGNELFFFYKKYYSKEFKSFKFFLNEVLNKEFVFDNKLLKNPKYPKRFKINPKIEKDYSALGFNKFLEKYSKASSRKGELELNKSNLKNDEYLTIAYFLYINRYDISQDCYLGKDYIYKREDYFEFYN